jgi:hypothetical protein
MVDRGVFGGRRRRNGGSSCSPSQFDFIAERGSRRPRSGRILKTTLLVVLVSASSFFGGRWLIDEVLSPHSLSKSRNSGDSVVHIVPTSPGPDIPFDPPKFRDVAREVGIVFTYDNGAQGRKLLVETTGGGAGWLDYDRDGHCDLYLVQGGATAVHDRSGQPTNRLYRNLGDGEFQQVGRLAGLDDRGYGQGVAVADFDNDGFDDLYVTNVGSNVLFHNMGDGTFERVTKSARIDDLRWSNSAAWGDLDQDGDLDLYVCNYTKYDVFDPLLCGTAGDRAQCSPHRSEPDADSCFFNQGDGTFRELSVERGLTGEGNRALGVVIAHLVSNDGAPQVYVANDGTANFMFVNNGTGSFTDQALKRGCAGNIRGGFQGSMGVALADYDRNGRLDLYVTHFTPDYNTLYQNMGGQFTDVTAESALDKMEWLVGWGTVMSDFNQDGRCDLFVSYGGVDVDSKGEPEMPSQLFSFQLAESEWVDCTHRAGPFFQQQALGRGVASADYDNDGDLDLCVVHQNSPTALLENVSQRGHWLKFRLIGLSSNRSAIGTRVTVTQGEQTLYQELAGGTSYCASAQPVLIFGLGDSDLPCSVKIQWPNGTTQHISENFPVDQELLFIEGQPQPQLTHYAERN